MLFISGLTGFLSNFFTDEANTFTFVGFGFTIRANLVANLTEELFIATFEGNERVFTFFGNGGNFDFFRKFENDIV